MNPGFGTVETIGSAAQSSGGSGTMAARSDIPVKTTTPRDLLHQRFFAWLLCIPFQGIIASAFRWVGYEIENRAETRRRFREMYRASRRDGVPLVVCCNHLTFIDSCILIWAFGSSFWYFRNFSGYTWNLPAGDFFKKKLLYRVVAYLGKGIFIHRDGSAEHKLATLDLCVDVINRGEVLTVFPEGRRSRHPHGAFEADRMAQGVGKIVTAAKDCRVLCVYLRSDRQKAFSSYPPKGSKFRIEMELIQPTFTHEGKKGCTEVLKQICGTIARLEREYFSRSN